MPKPGRRGRPREVEFREVINAVRYLVRSGCGWRMLPVHFGHWRTVYGWFRELARRFLFQSVAGPLRSFAHGLRLVPGTCLPLFSCSRPSTTWSRLLARRAGGRGLLGGGSSVERQLAHQPSEGDAAIGFDGNLWPATGRAEAVNKTSCRVRPVLRAPYLAAIPILAG